MRFLFVFFFLWLAHFAQAQKPAQHFIATKRLKTLLEAAASTDSLQVVLLVNDVAHFQKTFTQGKLLALYAPAKTVTLKLTKAVLLTLMQQPNILFADAQRQPKEELTTGSLDITLNRLNYAHHVFPHLKGSGIRASVKEQLFDTADIDFKGRYFNSGVAGSIVNSHATIMATMLGGGGNTSLQAVGAAPGVQLTSSSFTTLLPDADAVYQQHRISVQNHSYGTDIENYYGADARAYDISALQNPKLLHVFSSGNKGSGTPSDGAYKGVEGFANLTGSFKMAKNSITVGAVDSFNQVMPLSSKGPAYDGRIKPELVAFGLDGSSGAAALASGTAALVQQAYQSVHNSLPSSALVKAVLINSADDKGPAEVDFAYGFGSLNAYRALTTLLNQQTWESSLAKREIKHFTIAVPKGMAQLKITLAWTDAPAEVTAAKALVNDLDATLSLKDKEWLPWVLNAAASQAALSQLAARAIDTLNNVEQITIQNPEAGEYTITIDGQKMVTDAQAFAVAYQLDTAAFFAFTYPTSSNPLPAQTKQLIRWQSTFSEAAVIEYSTGNNNWQTIGVAPAQKGFQTFTVPPVTGRLFFRARMQSIGQTFFSDTIVVTPELSLKTGLHCADSLLLYWPPVVGAQYQLYRLGQRYMEPFALTSDTFMVLHTAVQPQVYFAVAPWVAGKEGYRSSTIDYTAQGVECYVKTFFAFREGNRVRLDLQLGSLYNIQKIAYQVLNSQKGFETFFTDAAPAAVSLQAFHAAPKQGVNQYRAAITTANGAVVFSPVETVYFFTDNPVILYPNPARQAEPIRILAQEPDTYFIQVMDAAGRTVFSFKLDDIRQTMPALRLSKGVYFVRCWSDENRYKTQKLVVY